MEDIPELAAALIRPAWHLEAACRGMGPALFFAGPGGTPKAARAVCARCPVVEQCGAHAAENREEGIWAGTSPNDRKRAAAA